MYAASGYQGYRKNWSLVPLNVHSHDWFYLKGVHDMHWTFFDRQTLCMSKPTSPAFSPCQYKPVKNGFEPLKKDITFRLFLSATQTQTHTCFLCLCIKFHCVCHLIQYNTQHKQPYFLSHQKHWRTHSSACPPMFSVWPHKNQIEYLILVLD